MAALNIAPNGSHSLPAAIFDDTEQNRTLLLKGLSKTITQAAVEAELPLLVAEIERVDVISRTPRGASSVKVVFRSRVAANVALGNKTVALPFAFFYGKAIPKFSRPAYLSQRMTRAAAAKEQIPILSTSPPRLPRTVILSPLSLSISTSLHQKLSPQVRSDPATQYTLSVMQAAHFVTPNSQQASSSGAAVIEPAPYNESAVITVGKKKALDKGKGRQVETGNIADNSIRTNRTRASDPLRTPEPNGYEDFSKPAPSPWSWNPDRVTLDWDVWLSTPLKDTARDTDKSRAKVNDLAWDGIDLTTVDGQGDDLGEGVARNGILARKVVLSREGGVARNRKRMRDGDSAREGHVGVNSPAKADLVPLTPRYRPALSTLDHNSLLDDPFSSSFSPQPLKKPRKTRGLSRLSVDLDPLVFGVVKVTKGVSSD